MADLSKDNFMLVPASLIEAVNNKRAAHIPPLPNLQADPYTTTGYVVAPKSGDPLYAHHIITMNDALDVIFLCAHTSGLLQPISGSSNIYPSNEDSETAPSRAYLNSLFNSNSNAIPRSVQSACSIMYTSESIDTHTSQIWTEDPFRSSDPIPSLSDILEHPEYISIPTVNIPEGSQLKASDIAPSMGKVEENLVNLFSCAYLTSPYEINNYLDVETVPSGRGIFYGAWDYDPNNGTTGFNVTFSLSDKDPKSKIEITSPYDLSLNLVDDKIQRKDAIGDIKCVLTVWQYVQAAEYAESGTRYTDIRKTSFQLYDTDELGEIDRDSDPDGRIFFIPDADLVKAAIDSQSSEIGLDPLAYLATGDYTSASTRNGNINIRFLLYPKQRG